MEQGILDYFGIKCVYTQLENDFLLFPIEDNKMREMHQLSQGKNYLLKFHSSFYKDSYIFVNKVSARPDNSFSIKSTYIAKMIENDGITKIRIIGDELDAFFSPTRYFFIKQETGTQEKYDLNYEKGVAFSYSFSYL